MMNSKDSLNKSSLPAFLWINPRYSWLDIYNRKYGSIENNFDGALKMLAYSIVTFSTPLTVLEGNSGDNFYLLSDAHPILSKVQIFTI